MTPHRLSPKYGKPRVLRPFHRHWPTSRLRWFFDYPQGELMARILITGSTDGLGLMAAKLLAKDGHAVTLHARNQRRAADAREQLPAAKHVVIGDLASIEEMHQVADQA